MSDIFNELNVKEMMPENNDIQNNSGYFAELGKEKIAKCYKKMKKLKKKKKEYGYLQKKDKRKYKKLKKKMIKLKQDNKAANQYYCQHLEALKKENFILKAMLISQYEDGNKAFEKMFLKKIHQDVESNFIDVDAKFID